MSTPTERIVAKTVCNNPDDAADEALEGLLLLRPDLCLVGPPSFRIVCRAAHDRRKVSVLCGGGSGHEPAHAGFVGIGMLTAAVSGGIFASPNVRAITAALLHACGPGGGLLIVKNYTGDRLAFTPAAEAARAQGLQVEVVFTEDDCALEGGRCIGRRGLAGTVLVYKIAGALAELGAPLAAVASAARWVAARLATMGVSFSACEIPGQVPSARFSGSAAVEVGLGIHGEPGARRLEGIPTCKDLCAELLAKCSERLLGTAPAEKAPVALLINNNGGLSNLEVAIVVRTCVAWFDAESCPFALSRLICGPVMTSMAARGFSLTLLPLTGTLHDLAPAFTADAACLLDAPALCGASWPGCTAPTHPLTAISLAQSIGRAPIPAAAAASRTREDALTCWSFSNGEHDDSCSFFFKDWRGVCAALKESTARLNDLDTRVGDGDTGTTYSGMAGMALQSIEAHEVGLWVDRGGGQVAPPDFLVSALLPSCLHSLSDALAEHAGGSSGMLCTLFFRALANALEGKLSLGAAVHRAATAVGAAGNSKEGDRSLLDVLFPVARALLAVEASEQPCKLTSVAEAAIQGAAATAFMLPAAGRSSKVSEEVARGVIDPGAAAAAVCVCAALGMKADAAWQEMKGMVEEQM